MLGKKKNEICSAVAGHRSYESHHQSFVLSPTKFIFFFPILHYNLCTAVTSALPFLFNNRSHDSPHRFFLSGLPRHPTASISSRTVSVPYLLPLSDPLSSIASMRRTGALRSCLKPKSASSISCFAVPAGYMQTLPDDLSATIIFTFLTIAFFL